MTIKFLRDWPGHCPGTITDQVGEGIAEQLIRRGIAVEVKAVSVPKKHKMIREKTLAK